MIVKSWLLWVVLSLFLPLREVTGQTIYNTNQAKIDFISEAPLETIKATSRNCRGVLNMDTGEFIFSIPVKTFEGFNNPLQKIHFQENYLEVATFPEATFRGRIIDEFQFIDSKTQQIRTKGDLEIHGVAMERIIPVELIFKQDTFSFTSSFKILLEDHLINIPRIVRQKISKEIDVLIEGSLKPRS